MGGALYSDGEGCMCVSGESGCASEVRDVYVDYSVSQSSTISCMSSGRGDVVRGVGGGLGGIVCGVPLKPIHPAHHTKINN